MSIAGAAQVIGQGVGKGMDRTSKMLTALTGYGAWVMQSGLPEEVKIKHLLYALLAYLVMQGGKDMVKAWKGRKPSTGSNADEPVI